MFFMSLFWICCLQASQSRENYQVYSQLLHFLQPSESEREKWFARIHTNLLHKIPVTQVESFGLFSSRKPGPDKKNSLIQIIQNKIQVMLEQRHSSLKAAKFY